VENGRSGGIDPTGGGINNNDSTPHASGNAANQAGSSFFPLPWATTYEWQLSRLRERGLVVNDETFALAKLKDLNYYRLCGYWLTLEQDDSFAAGTSFDDIWEIYQLDRDLRGWLWRAIAPIEIKLRMQFAYQFAHLCGPDAYLDANNFWSRKNYGKAMDNYERERNRAYNQNVPYVIHNMDKYGKLPVWAAVEIMSFGTLSMLYGSLDLKAGKTNDHLGVADAVAGAFGTKQRYLKSWAHHLITVRSIAAHHDRFYNRMINIQPTMLKRDARYAGNKQYPTFIVIRRIYERSWPDDWDMLSSELSECFDGHPNVDLRPMGFTKGWRKPLGL
jgi:abortive infection bacteriophage resistance protein